MPTNFLDPSQADQFRQRALMGGESPAKVDAYIRSKVAGQMKETQLGLDLGKQQLEGLKLQRDMASLVSGKPEVSAAAQEKQRFASLSRNTLNQMKSIYGMGDAANVGTGKDLSEGEGILGKLGRRSEDLVAGITGQSNSRRDSAKEFNDLAQMLVGQLSQAFGSGTPQEGEAKRLIASMPTRGSNDKTSKAWFDNVDRLLAQSAGEEVPTQQKPGLGLGSPKQPFDAPTGSAPALNLKGEVAKYGDVVFNQNKGQLETYGKPVEDTVFKKTTEGSNIDNSFIKFLADSEFLPIAGSVVGGLSGAGVASIATGAAGAVAGKALQQGIRELFDPNRQDMSDMAKAVVIEGATDAIMGGVFFGLGSVAGKGLKMVFSNAPGMAKVGGEVAGEALEEGAEVATKAGTPKVVRDLTARGLGIKPATQQAKYASSFEGADLVGDIIEKFGIPKSGAALKESGEKLGKESAAKLTTLLDGKSAPVNEVIEELEKIKSGAMYDAPAEQGLMDIVDSAMGTGKKTDIPKEMLSGQTVPTPKADYKAGVNKLDEYLTEIKAFGDEIPLLELNSIKQRMQKSFGKSLETSSVSKGLVQDASTSMRKYIEKYDPKIAGTNQEKMLAYMATEIGEALDQKKAKAIFDLVDVGLLAANPAAAAIKKSADVFTNVFRDPLTQARILDEMLKINVSQGNRMGVRNTLRIMQRLGVSFGANALTPEAKEAEQSTAPGLEMPTATQPMAAPGMGLGGGYPRYLYR